MRSTQHLSLDALGAGRQHRSLPRSRKCCAWSDTISHRILSLRAHNREGRKRSATRQEKIVMLPENTRHPMTVRPDLPSLAWALLRVGAVAFGGLGATLALLNRDLV